MVMDRYRTKEAFEQMDAICDDHLLSDVLSSSPSGILTYYQLRIHRELLSDHSPSSSSNPENFELYRSFRDCLPSKDRLTPTRQTWRADLIRYGAIPLPDDEPCRSTGHWNPPDQIEIFEVLAGRVIILVMLPDGEIEILECSPGSSWRIPTGAYHLTYAFESSLVLNIYNANAVGIDSHKYVRGEVPSIFIKGKNFDQFSLVKIADGGLVLIDPHEYRPRTCVQLPFDLRSLHDLDDNDFAAIISTGN